MLEDQNQLLTLCTFDLPHEAHLLKGFLESCEIPTFLQDEHIVGLNWFQSNVFGGIKLQVRKCDFEVAKQKYEDFKQGTVIEEEE